MNVFCEKKIGVIRIESRKTEASNNENVAVLNNGNTVAFGKYESYFRIGDVISYAYFEKNKNKRVVFALFNHTQNIGVCEASQPFLNRRLLKLGLYLMPFLIVVLAIFYHQSDYGLENNYLVFIQVGAALMMFLMATNIANELYESHVALEEIQKS